MKAVRQMHMRNKALCSGMLSFLFAPSLRKDPQLEDVPESKSVYENWQYERFPEEHWIEKILDE